MCECKNLDAIEQTIIRLSKIIKKQEEEISNLNKEMNFQNLLIDLKNKEIEEFSSYIDNCETYCETDTVTDKLDKKINFQKIILSLREEEVRLYQENCETNE